MNRSFWRCSRVVTPLLLALLLSPVALSGAAAGPGVQATPAAGDPCEAAPAVASPGPGAMPMGTPMAGMAIEFDRLFIDMMIPHHVAAVAMAEVALVRAEHEELRELAAEVIAAQGTEIAQLQAWRDQWYPGAPVLPMAEMEAMMAGMTGDAPGMEMMGMTMDPAAELAALCAAPEPFDLAFIDAMIPHHQTAIAMAEAALDRSTHPELAALHAAIIETQQREIEQMLKWRAAWFEAGTPAGPVQTPSAAAADFVAGLDARGVRVRDRAGVPQPFLDAEATATLRLRGGELRRPAEVLIYLYEDREQAGEDAAAIGPDGQPATSRITWVEPPHFYRQGELIVLYLGTDEAVLDLLAELLGEPFAVGSGVG